ncbi:MAG: methionyl-tRNA formyltransferase [Armatimonadota bacterium]|nr:methionyl-tRNA formyltransferase [Armatimonadota bacterium]
MRVVFMGTPEFAVPSLRALCAAGHDVAGVVSQPNRPRGRAGKADETPVAAAARQLGLQLWQPESVNTPDFLAQLQAVGPEVVVVVAFGQILRKPLLEAPRLGCVNVHASLLPRYRGGSPVQHALLNGDGETGVTTMLMDVGLDTGPILLQQPVPIYPEDDAGTLLQRLSVVGADLLLRTLAGMADGQLQPTPQNDAEATYAPNLGREDARIDWTHSAPRIHNRVRAFSPRPGCWSVLKGREVKVWRAAPALCSRRGRPGEVLEVSAKGVLVAAGEGCVWLAEVQEAGRARMPAGAFARGARLVPGDRFE